MPYIGYAPARKPLTSADITDGVITSASISDGTIVNADINASAGLALSKLSTTGTASSSNYLRGDGAWTAVSSDYVLLATTDASASASVSFDGYFSSTYKNYKVIFSNLIAGTSGSTNLQVRYRRSNADVTASNYVYAGSGAYVYSGPTGDLASVRGYNDSKFLISQPENVSTSASYGGTNGELTLFNPLSTASYKYFNANTGILTTVIYYTNYSTGTLQDSTAALSGITFYMSSGNITSGTFKLYGLK